MSLAEALLILSWCPSPSWLSSVAGALSDSRLVASAVAPLMASVVKLPEPLPPPVVNALHVAPSHTTATSSSAIQAIQPSTGA